MFEARFNHPTGLQRGCHRPSRTTLETFATEAEAMQAASTPRPGCDAVLVRELEGTRIIRTVAVKRFRLTHRNQG